MQSAQNTREPNVTEERMMKLLSDLFFTDYGLMSLVVIALIIIVMAWAAVHVMNLMKKE